MPVRPLFAAALLATSALSVAAGPETALESRLEAAGQRFAAGELGAPLQLDPALRGAARDLALVLASGARVDTQEFVRAALAEHGLLDPYPYVFYGSAPAARVADLESKLVAGLRALPPGERRLYTHVAAGVIERPRRRFLVLKAPTCWVAVLVTQRAVSYAPLPAEVQPGDRLRLEGEIHTPFRDPELLLTTPDGATRQLDNLATEPLCFRTWLHFDRGAGPYQLEVLGRYDMGPRVLGLTTLTARAPGTPTAHARIVDAARSGSLAVAVTVAPRPAPPTDAASAEERLLELLNRDRRRAGLLPLAAHPGLAAMARAHSRDMLEHDFFAHVSPRNGRLLERAAAAGIHYSRLAENIAVHRSVEDAEAELLRSPGHRRNILSPDFTCVGLGVALVEVAPGEPRVYVTQNFMAP